MIEMKRKSLCQDPGSEPTSIYYFIHHQGASKLDELYDRT